MAAPTDQTRGTRLRPYQQGDEEKVLALWQRSLPTDPVTRDVFTARILLDVNFDKEGFIVAEAGDEVVGFIYAAVRSTPLYGDDFEPDAGWVSVFFVHPAWRRQGIGTALVQAALAYVRVRGRAALAISPYVPNYFWPGPDVERHAGAVALLEKMGFQTLEEPVAMDVNLVGFTVPDDVLRLREERAREGYTIDALEHRHIADVLVFNYRHFGADWSRAVRDALLRAVSMDHVLVAHRGDEIVGFCLYGGYDHAAERFGPFGVRADLRGMGLGKLLLYDCLQRMQGSGLHNAYFMWTGEDDPAGHLYRRAGFRVTRRFRVFRRAV
jgi:GNAT superfamily N-acetyltransferase